MVVLSIFEGLELDLIFKSYFETNVFVFVKISMPNA
jgi:hypothetical protein